MLHCLHRPISKNLPYLFKTLKTDVQAVDGAAVKHFNSSLVTLGRPKGGLMFYP